MYQDKSIMGTRTWMCVYVHVCMLKDLCGLSGFRDEDKIAEGVRPVIAFEY